MARKYQQSTSSGHTILVVDDSPDILESTRRLLEADGHRVLTAPDGKTALGIVDRERIHLMLLDYFMPGMTGEEVVQEVRKKDTLVQIILATGYSGEKPARVMMRHLDIQGYHDKGDGAERLLLWVDAALKTYRHVVAMEKHRVGLRFVLDITPQMHRIQPLDELLQGLLWQIEGLLGAENCFLATFSPEAMRESAEIDGFVAVVGNAAIREWALEVRFGTGRFRSGTPLDLLPEPELGIVQEAIQDGEVKIQNSVSVIPLRLGTKPLGIIYIDRRMEYDRDRELLEVFANQAAAAIQNALLFEMATTDSMTGAHLRGFAMQRLHQALKAAHRRVEPLSLLMVDVDRFKEINDRHGHHVGDRALRAVAELLLWGVRETDVVGRYGGDEFMVVLPETPTEGARIVAERLRERVKGLTVEVGDRKVPVHLSIGLGSLSPPEDAAGAPLKADGLDRVGEELIASADRALYAKKGTGEVGESEPVLWEALIPVAR